MIKLILILLASILPSAGSSFFNLLFSIFLTFASDLTYPPGWDELQVDTGWELINETNQITIYRKSIPVSPLPAYRAELTTKVNIDALIEAAWLVEKSPDVFSNAYLIEAGIYNHDTDSSYTAFQLFDIPFLAPRLYQFNSLRNNYNIHWTKTDTLPVRLNPGNHMLPLINFGSWKVEKLGDKTRVTYRVCTNPGGNVPLWIVKQANQHYLPQMLLDLEKWANNH